MAELKEYRLTGKGYSKKVEKQTITYKKGELVPLTESQYVAFKDQFEEEDAAEKALKAQKAADEKVKKEKTDSDEAIEARKKELEKRGKEESDASDKDEGKDDEDKGDEASNPTAPEPNKTNPLAKAAAAVGKVAGGGK